MSKQISAIDRLRELPTLFRGAHLTTRFRWDSKTASQYLYLWKRRNLVQGLGGHSDVFANLLFEPFPQYPNWEKALLMTMPSAVIVSVEVLRRVGWTTQIPIRLGQMWQSAQNSPYLKRIFLKLRHAIQLGLPLSRQVYGERAAYLLWHQAGRSRTC